MVAVAILAAGRGTRMRSRVPKVLHSLGGRSLVERVVGSLEEIKPERILLIVGYQGEQVAETLRSRYEQMEMDASLEFVTQSQQLGTGHAVQQVMPHLKDFDGDLLVLNGDVPLLRPDTLQNLLTTHQNQRNAATLLTAHLSNPKGYGRVFCDANNVVTQIVEHRDCTTAQRQNRRVNAGVYCFRWRDLSEILPQLEANNDQQEYYLTDVIAMMQPVTAVDVEDPQEILGINDRKQLATAYEILQARIKDHWMMAGVTMIDPGSITIDDSVILEPDTIVEPQTHLRGNTIIHSGSHIGPGSLIENSEIGADSRVLSSVISDSRVGAGSRIGPYTHLRGHVQVGEACRVGNFVELKNASLGDRTNVAHLSYLGDATLGQQVNVGAGTITANYDGEKKHHTTVGDRTKTGSNSVLVAPINIGADVTIAAGSTVTEDVDDDALVIARSRQVVKPGWRLNHSNSAQP